MVLLVALPAISQDVETLDAPAGEKIENVVDDSTNEVALEFSDAQTSLIQNAMIAAPMDGVVASVEVVEGAMVAQDAPLIRLRSDLAERELQAAKAAWDAATLESDNDVNLRYAQRTYEVRKVEQEQSELANQTYAGAVSEMELREVKLKADQASLAIEQARHDLMIASASAVEKEAAVAIAQTKLDRHTVRSGVAGMVTEIDVEPGEWVEAGKPAVRVISLDPIRVECFIDGRTHGRELVGRSVQFVLSPQEDENTDANGEAIVLSGSITFVSPEINPVTGQVRLWATMKNPNRKVGSGASGRLIVE